jgi:hypothetical protein
LDDGVEAVDCEIGVVDAIDDVVEPVLDNEGTLPINQE